MYVCMYVCVYVYIASTAGLNIAIDDTYNAIVASLTCISPGPGHFRRRENMVGVNMVLAEYHKIKICLLYIYLLFAS